jgi:hypothetical protein
MKKADLEEAGRVNGGLFGYTMRHILVPLMLLNHGSRRSDGIRRGEPTGGQHRAAYNQRH